MIDNKYTNLMRILCVFLLCWKVHGISLPVNDLIRDDGISNHKLYSEGATKSNTSSVWSWVSWTDVYQPRNELKERSTEECGNKTDDGDFPEDLFTDDQLRQGAIILHFIGGIYSFTLLAFVCNDFFIPSVECICEDLHLSRDVAAATFMAIATSCPELFVNIVSTFVTKSDLGLGTIVGSSLFNTLGVGAVGGIAAKSAIKIMRWPVTRDCIIYSLNVAVLVTMTWDNRIEWYEATILLCLYIAYFFFMFNNKRVYNLARKMLKVGGGFHVGQNSAVEDKSEEDSLESENKYTHRVSHSLIRASIRRDDYKKASLTSNTAVVVDSIWRYPREASTPMQIWFVITWPLNFILTYTIPSPIMYRRAYPITFIMCIIWIGINSYFVSWMMTTIGKIIGIPDSIMGMTFLAFGGCLPEACSIFIMSRKDEGGMGVSNSLGANSLAILFSLGIPWFIKCMLLISKSKEAFIPVESTGLDYVIMSLFFAIASLYITLTIGKFELKKLTGAFLLIIYLIFITIAILLESGVLINLNIPPC